MTSVRALVIVSLVSLAGCKKGEPSPTDEPPFTPESPQAKAVPAPLANSPSSATGSPKASTFGADAGSAPLPMRGDAPHPADTSAKESGLAFSFSMALRTGDPGGPAKGGDVNASGVESARKATETILSVDIGAARARFAIGTRGFVLPVGTELRARADRYGHIVLWPDGRSYQIAPPGSLRALLQERRFDVSSFSSVQVSPPSDGPKRFGIRTRRIELTTRIAHATVDLGRVEGLGEGGALVCRSIAELVNAWPAISISLTDEIPLHAELAWNIGGSLTLDAIALPHRSELSTLALTAPPPTARFTDTIPLRMSNEVVLSSVELASLRSPLLDPNASEHDTSLELINATDRLRFVWLEGLPVAWIAPGDRLTVSGLSPSLYALQWRTFLGDSLEPTQTLRIPGTSTLGVLD